MLIKPYNLSDHIQPSLGLGYLATSVRNKAEVRILDCIKEKVKLNRLGAFIRGFQPDVIGFQCYTFDLGFIKQALRIVKGINERIITMVGGPHPSAVPPETLEYFGKDLDFCFKGESEKSLSLFIDRLNGGSINLRDIPGLVWRENSRIESNACYFEDDLDTLGLPSWDLIRPETYPESQHGAVYKKFPIAPIMLTRGCPYRCTFCAGKLTNGEKLRKRGITSILNEINMLYSERGIREFHLVDDNFTLDRNYVKSFLKELILRHWDISLATPNGVRLDTLDEELLSLLKESGLYLISLGIESGSNRVLKLMKKNLTVEKTKEAIRLIKKFDIDIAGFFILGFPGETKEEILKTIKLSLELDLVRANYFTYLPFPGTESYQGLIKDGGFGRVDWERFYFMNAAFTPEGMTRQGLKNLQRLAFLRFFMRPRIFWKNLCAIRSFRHLRFLLRRFFHWVIMS